MAIIISVNHKIAPYKRNTFLLRLCMFNQRELQRLISGVDDGNFDVDDLRSHTEYHGGYSDRHSTIIDFWKVDRSSRSGLG